MMIVHSDNAGEAIEPNRNVTAGAATSDETTSVPKPKASVSVLANEDVLDDDDGGGGGLMVNLFH